MEYTIELDGIEYMVEVTDYYGGCDAKLNALPENCYPAEDPEIEYDIIGAVEYDDEGDAHKVEAEDSDELNAAVLARHQQAIEYSRNNGGW